MILVGLVVGVAMTWAASPAGATHAYRCEETGDPRVDRAWCLTHRAWDAVSGGHPQAVLCAVQDALGVDHVQDCRLSP